MIDGRTFHNVGVIEKQFSKLFSVVGNFCNITIFSKPLFLTHVVMSIHIHSAMSVSQFSMAVFDVLHLHHNAGEPGFLGARPNL